MLTRLRSRLYPVLALTIGLTSCLAASADPIARDRIHPVDGDTIYVQGQNKNTRLTGFNAPEMGKRAQCPGEAAMGKTADDRLRELLDEGPLDLTFERCACTPGTEGTKSCNFERTCAVLKVNGTDVGETLIADGLAVPFVCGETSCPPTPRRGVPQGDSHSARPRRPI